MTQLLAATCTQVPNGIKITGSNGKGSTAAMVASILNSHGIRCGLYTSPHLFSVCERMSIDGLSITEGELSVQLESTVRAAQQIAPNRFGAFEILTATAAAWFVSKQVDVVVWEAGIGGRLDATKVLPARVSALVNVALEHTHLLGNTRSQIAVDKAGIADPGSLLVLGPLGDLEHLIADAHPELTLINADTPPCRPALLGAHQQENAACATTTAKVWLGTEFSQDACIRGLQQVRWPLRFELLCKKPNVWVDAAHNLSGAKRIAQTVREVLEARNLILVFGASEDREYAAMAQILCPLAQEVILTAATHKGVNPRLIEQSYDGPCHLSPDVKEAVSYAMRLAEQQEADVLITGGLFLAAEAALAVRGTDTSTLCFL